MTGPSRPKNYSAEVLTAMRIQGLLPADPTPEPVPEGLIRYSLHVGGVISTDGVAAPAAVAATLRGLADQLDPQKEHHA